MGKRASRAIIEKYYGKLTNDFHTNKRIIDDCTVVQSKRLRNKIAGFTTRLMKRIQTGPVRGISLRLQEEEREKRWISSPRDLRFRLRTSEPAIRSSTLSSRSSESPSLYPRDLRPARLEPAETEFTLLC